MKLISRFEAAALGTAQLYGLRKDAFVALCAAPHGSQAARDALCNMRTISIRKCDGWPDRPAVLLCRDKADI